MSSPEGLSCSHALSVTEKKEANRNFYKLWITLKTCENSRKTEGKRALALSSTLNTILRSKQAGKENTYLPHP